jgi:DNA gyrase subunit B
LLLTLFYRHFRPVIDGGFLYIANPPLYKVKRGKDIQYAYSEAEKATLVGAEEILETGETTGSEEGHEEAEAEIVTKKAPKLTIQRYKGLGEMNPEELWETTMDPSRRVLKRVTVDDAEEADKVFDILMGSDVAPRKSFIQSNAKLANLDI